MLFYSENLMLGKWKCLQLSGRQSRDTAVVMEGDPGRAGCSAACLGGLFFIPHGF